MLYPPPLLVPNINTALRNGRATPAVSASSMAGNVHATPHTPVSRGSIGTFPVSAPPRSEFSMAAPSAGLNRNKRTYSFRRPDDRRRGTDYLLVRRGSRQPHLFVRRSVGGRARGSAAAAFQAGEANGRAATATRVRWRTFQAGAHAVGARRLLGSCAPCGCFGVEQWRRSCCCATTAGFFCGAQEVLLRA